MVAQHLVAYKKPHPFRMSTGQFIEHSRLSFEFLRWSSLVAAAALPFTFAGGAVGAGACFGAVLVAAAWLASLLWAWGRRSEPGLAVSFIVFFFGSKWADVHSSDVPLSLFMP